MIAIIAAPASRLRIKIGLAIASKSAAGNTIGFVVPRSKVKQATALTAERG
jgi:hypothetical protein